jgi:hypothetical protein
MEHKSLKLVTRSNAKLKLALLRHLFNSRNISNAKPLCLVCNSMSLPLNGDGSSSKLVGSIYLGSHFLAVQVISPFHLLNHNILVSRLTLPFLLNNYLLL